MAEFSGDFRTIVENLTLALANAPDVSVGEWQAIQDDGLAQASTIELEDATIILRLPPTRQDLTNEVPANLPWAEEHFQERVSGIPYNPPPSHVNWPHASADNEEHRADGLFSHTYPERFWPRMDLDSALKEREGVLSGGFLSPRRGIRFEYGDLGEVVKLLRDRPATRQAYLPVWFPEDARAAVQGQRVPCTLGYGFLIRDGYMKITYYIRSCDFRRHFADDVYMAARLAQWMCSRLRGVEPGRLVMHISSLHIFLPEKQWLDDAAVRIRNARLGAGYY